MSWQGKKRALRVGISAVIWPGESLPKGALLKLIGANAFHLKVRKLAGGRGLLTSGVKLVKSAMQPKTGGQKGFYSLNIPQNAKTFVAIVMLYDKPAS